MKFNIKTFKGLLRENFNTAFPMIDANWVSKHTKKTPAKQYSTLEEASADVQLYFRGQGAEIVEVKYLWNPT